MKSSCRRSGRLRLDTLSRTETFRKTQSTFTLKVGLPSESCPAGGFPWPGSRCGCGGGACCGSGCRGSGCRAGGEGAAGRSFSCRPGLCGAGARGITTGTAVTWPTSIRTGPCRLETYSSGPARAHLLFQHLALRLAAVSPGQAAPGARPDPQVDAGGQFAADLAVSGLDPRVPRRLGAETIDDVAPVRDERNRRGQVLGGNLARSCCSPARNRPCPGPRSPGSPRKS